MYDTNNNASLLLKMLGKWTGLLFLRDIYVLLATTKVKCIQLCQCMSFQTFQFALE